MASDKKHQQKHARVETVSPRSAGKLSPPAGTCRLRWVATLGLILVAAIAGHAGPMTQPIELKERLNQEYAHELVAFPFTPMKKGCLAESVQLTGPGGPAAVQLSEIEAWPGKKRHVKSARLRFIVDELKPLATQVLTMAYGTKSASPVSTDLQVKPVDGGVEITTSRMGIRLPLGEQHYPQPMTVKSVPGPLQAMRLANGVWSGGSALAGEAPVSGWSARLTDAGPVFARVALTYTFENGKALNVEATVAAGDNGCRWEMLVEDDRPELALEFRLPAMPGVKEAVLPKGYGQWATDRTLALAPSADPFCFLSPDTSLANIWPECPATIRLATADGRELVILSRDPAAWADPAAPLTYGGFKTWDMDSIPKMWEVWKRKRMAVTYGGDGVVSLRAALTKGRRLWTVSAGMPRVGDRLDRVKDLVLEWPSASAEPHPRLFVSRQEVGEDWARAGNDPDMARLLAAVPSYAGPALAIGMKPPEKRTPEEWERTVAALRDQLAKMGRFDVMRHAIGVAAHYDALIDHDGLAAGDKALFRAQMAYLGYVMADPGTWSMERGYLSGNPNISCSYTLSLGVIACALSEHPMARSWADYATRWMDKWLTDEVGANGEWMPEGSHYGLVSLAPMLSYAVAAQRAGFHDFSTDPRLKKLLLYFAKVHTPRDPQRRNARVTPAFGRGTSGDTLGVFGLAARLYAESDPDLSRTLQWMWAENGYPVDVGDSRLGGFEGYYMERRLPSAAPKWGSELFPNTCALLRSGFNTPHESFVNVIACAQSRHNLDIWVPGIGGIAQWFGRGQPLSTSFAFQTGYSERHELLRDGVLLARNWGDAADPKGPFGYYTETRFDRLAAVPQADYVRSAFVITQPDDRDWFPKDLPAYPRLTPAKEARLDWTRQVLFVKDPDAAGPAYLVLRDTTSGGQPTAWQFWSLSEKLGTPEQAHDPASFLTDRPGQAILPARGLPQSDRYTALGQFGMDIEFFIASPTDTPRHTLRFGGVWANVPEYQDLLHLQRPGDGAYYVVVFPRPRTEAAPAFSTLAGGQVVRVAGPFGTDYAFLSHLEATAAEDVVSFRGTAAAVQQRGDDTTLSLAAAGEVRWKDYGLDASTAVSLRVAPDALGLALPADSPGGPIALTAPGNWALQEPAAGAKLEAGPGRYLLTAPRGILRVTLLRRTK
ncbi:MAG: hypothetical protein HYU36_02165 [Planctomycetes bacterium]|nr:hypothetical protein [Planctomycetota bacterium]